ncbi:TPA: hypothetical protein N3F75_004405 [Klebsiella aerogenes]|nr:hypothetical protein [Klebsiella aerogenes]
MTDITELATVLRLAAESEIAHRAEGDTSDLWQDEASPDNILALVEALEKAQQVDEELCKLLPPGVEYMDPPDGGDVTPLEGVRRMVADYRQRIAELKSRTVTVKLPLRKNAADYFDDEYSNEDLAAIFNTCRLQCKVALEKALLSAGIKAEAESVNADVNDRNKPGMVVAVHIDAGDFVKFRGQVYEVKETHFDDHDVTLWFVCGEALKCAAGCQIEVISAPEESE